MFHCFASLDSLKINNSQRQNNVLCVVQWLSGRFVVQCTKRKKKCEGRRKHFRFTQPNKKKKKKKSARDFGLENQKKTECPNLSDQVAVSVQADWVNIQVSDGFTIVSIKPWFCLNEHGSQGVVLPLCCLNHGFVWMNMEVRGWFYHSAV